MSALHAYDYFLLQFGTNDGNRSASCQLKGESIQERGEDTLARFVAEGLREAGVTSVTRAIAAGDGGVARYLK